MIDEHYEVGDLVIYKDEDIGVVLKLYKDYRHSKVFWAREMKIGLIYLSSSCIRKLS